MAFNVGQLFTETIHPLNGKKRKSLACHPINFVHDMTNSDIEIKYISVAGH